VKAVIETEVAVPVWSKAVQVKDGDVAVWLATWLRKRFKGQIVGDRITYGKMRITFEVM